MSYSFKIINSSAGSGKTFYLAIEFIVQLLNSKKDDHYKSMLALTFTNKSSAEMKDRILSYLNILVNEDENVILDIVSNKTTLSKLKIKEKAFTILENILYNYSSFNVMTIDSFTNNILKSFKPELDIENDYLVELDSMVYIDQAIDDIFFDINDDNYLKNQLIEFARFKTTINKSWDISHDLREFIVLIDKESNRDQIEYFSQKNKEFFSQMKLKVNNLKKEKKKYLRNVAKKSLELISTNDLDFADFRGSYLPNYLNNIIINDELYINESIYKSLNGETSLYNKSLSNSKSDIIEKIRSSLLNNYNEINKIILDILILNSFLSHLPSLSLIKLIENKINKIQSENNTKLISKFNSELNLLVKSNDAPLIYEKLGSRFSNFFIDEFQDTSELQWENLIPLISNSIQSESHDGTKGSLLIVGDPKQSIYRWRGSRINQFVNLILGETNPFYINPEIEKIETNYRSSKNIVDFNSEFFSHLTNSLDLKIYNSSLLNFKQKSTKNEEGYVEIELYDSDTFYEKIKNQILDLLNRGYLPSEIIILVRKNKYAKELILNIDSPDFDLVSTDILQIKNSEIVQFVISIFKLSISGNNYSERKNIVDFLYKKNYFEGDYLTINDCFFDNLNKINIDDFFSRISKEKFDLNYFLKLNVLDSVKYCCSIFEIDLNNIFLAAFIDNIFEFLEKSNDSIDEYLNYWTKNLDKINLSLPDDQKSVCISTIHKSKGLEYPAVILPIYNDKLDENSFNDSLWLYEPFSEIESLKWMLIKRIKELNQNGHNLKEVYDSTVLNNYIDSINLLYVAFTRAEKELYILANNNKVRPNSISFLIKEFLDYKSCKNNFSFGKKIKYDIRSDNKEKLDLSGKIKIISTSGNVNQAKYISDTLSTIYNKNNTAKVYVFFSNHKLANLVNLFNSNHISMSPNYHILDYDNSKYDHVIISNMNEGLFPFNEINNDNVSETKKKEFENLNLIEKEKNISNLFYSLIENSKEVHLTFDSDLSSFINGEKSRFIKQLELLDTNYTISNNSISQKIIFDNHINEEIKRDKRIDQKINDILKSGISASTLNLFIKNPYLFYEQKILGIDDIEDSKYLSYMDQGTLIHEVIEKLYNPFKQIDLELKHIEKMRRNIDNQINESFIDLYSKKPEGKNLIFLEIVKDYITNILNFEKQQLNNENAHIKILSLEERLSSEITVNNKKVKINGIIDRIDLFNGKLRVIDYKSGFVNPTILDIKNLHKIKLDYRYSNLLQLLIYKLLVSNNYNDLDIDQIGIYSVKKSTSPFISIKDHTQISIKEVEKLLIEIIMDIIETNEFINTENPA